MHQSVDAIKQHLKFSEQRYDAHGQNLKLTDDRFKLTTNPQALIKSWDQNRQSNEKYQLNAQQELYGKQNPMEEIQNKSESTVLCHSVFTY